MKQFPLVHNVFAQRFHDYFWKWSAATKKFFYPSTEIEFFIQYWTKAANNNAFFEISADPSANVSAYELYHECKLDQFKQYDDYDFLLYLDDVGQDLFKMNMILRLSVRFAKNVMQSL